MTWRHRGLLVFLPLCVFVGCEVGRADLAFSGSAAEEVDDDDLVEASEELRFRDCVARLVDGGATLPSQDGGGARLDPSAYCELRKCLVERADGGTFTRPDGGAFLQCLPDGGFPRFPHRGHPCFPRFDGGWPRWDGGFFHRDGGFFHRDGG